MALVMNGIKWLGKSIGGVGVWFKLYRFFRSSTTTSSNTLMIDIEQREKEEEVAPRSVALVHASLASLTAVGYYLGVLAPSYVLEMRTLGDSYLAFEILMQYETLQRLLSYKIPHRKVELKRKHELTITHQKKKLFGAIVHHIGTFLWTHGMLVVSDELSTTLMYYVGEIPVVLLNWTWLLIFASRSQCTGSTANASRTCVGVSGLTVLCYFLFRIVWFFLNGGYLISREILFHPHVLSSILLSPWSWGSLALLGILYVQNWNWFWDLMGKPMDGFLPILPQSIVLLLQSMVVPRFSASLGPLVSVFDKKQKQQQKNKKAATGGSSWKTTMSDLLIKQIQKSPQDKKRKHIDDNNDFYHEEHEHDLESGTHDEYEEE